MCYAPTASESNGFTEPLRPFLGKHRDLLGKSLHRFIMESYQSYKHSLMLAHMGFRGISPPEAREPEQTFRPFSWTLGIFPLSTSLHFHVLMIKKRPVCVRVGSVMSPVGRRGNRRSGNGLGIDDVSDYPDRPAQDHVGKEKDARENGILFVDHRGPVVRPLIFF